VTEQKCILSSTFKKNHGLVKFKGKMKKKTKKRKTKKKTKDLNHSALSWVWSYE